MKSIFANKRSIFLLVFPALAVMIFAIITPIILSFYYGMTDWSGIGKMNFIGFENFKEIIFKDKIFWNSLLNSIILFLLTIFIQNPIAFIIAALLTNIKRGSRILRSIYFIPAIITVVVTTKLMVHILNPTYGLLNKFLIFIGLNNLALNWLSDPNTALLSVIFIIMWQGFGWALLFYYAGLSTVPKELIESAYIDGATGFILYIKVVIPYIKTFVQAVIIIALISCLKQMETVFLSTEGGPGDATQFIANYLYIRAFKYGQYGYGNAISILFIIIALTGTVLINKVLKSSDSSSY